jgi:hypothetical protein
VVRGTDLTGTTFEEHTFSENLCRGGTSFATRYPLSLGIHLDIQIPMMPTASREEAEFSTQGRVVHVKRGRTQYELVVGVEFTGPRFNRMFVSEAT